ncbi:hypothetical protein BC937DRAFT_93773 [Endogone sp. FLAS-F59071]|nr:hypothetical protein BC937DRAFT_93773 [Endogone sp. FLAS-F59071]|eukprot:RUS21045.1 hypothetical protein BC937DRAFT_93773 [Endogone sp. FLAS-F59071]
MPTPCLLRSAESLSWADIRKESTLIFLIHLNLLWKKKSTSNNAEQSHETVDAAEYKQTSSLGKLNRQETDSTIPSNTLQFEDIGNVESTAASGTEDDLEKEGVEDTFSAQSERETGESQIQSDDLGENLGNAESEIRNDKCSG